MALFAVPYTFRSAGKNTPLNRLDADFAAIANWFNARITTLGPLGSRPPAGNAGRLYIASDRHYSWYLDDGAVWRPVGGMGQGGITVNTDQGNLRFFGAGVGSGEGVLIGAAGTPPTTSPPDVGQLWLEDIQGEPGRMAWVTRPESGAYQPLDPVIFRTYGETSGFLGVSGTTETPVGAWTLQAHTLVGRSLEFALRYDLTNGSGAARTLTFRTKLGTPATTLASFGTVVPLGAAVRHGLYIHQIDPIEASRQRVSRKASTLWPVATSTTFTTTDGTLDPTTDLALSLTVQWNATGANVNCTALTVRLI